MAIEIFIRKLWDKLVPVDQAALDAMEALKINGEYKCVLTQIRNTDQTNKEKRRASQNRLMWGWFTDMEKTKINELAGNTKDDWHKNMKRRFLVPIFERDNQEYAEMVESIREAYRKGLKSQSLKMMDFVVKNTSTTDANVEQFTEYLKDIERYAHDNFIVLRTDSSIYKIAIGE